MYFGLDIVNKIGILVYVFVSGIVVFVDVDLYYLGGMLIFDYGYGVIFIYIYLSKLDVKIGDEIKCGDKIVEIGVIGCVIGFYLDWCFNWKNECFDFVLMM